MDLYHLEMEGNELQQASLEVKSTAALNGGLLFKGRFAWDDTLGYPVVHNGSAWVPMGGAGPVSFSQFPLGTLGLPIIGQGASAPVYGQISFATGITGTLQASQMPAFTGDVSNSGLALTVNLVGGASAANIADASSKRHTQNTDIGTSSTTFQFGTGGALLQTVNGELQARNAANNDYADIRVKNIYQEGTTTILNGNEVNIGDSNVLLNWEITTAAANSDGGLTVKRLKAPAAGAGTIATVGTAVTGTGTSFTGYNVGDALVNGGNARLITAINSATSMTIASAFPSDLAALSSYSVAVQANAVLNFNNSTGLWEVIDGPTSAPVTHALVRKYAVNIPGNNALTSFTITHNLNTTDINSVSIIELTGLKRIGTARFEIVDANTITVKFAKAPADALTYRCVVAG